MISLTIELIDELNEELLKPTAWKAKFDGEHTAKLVLKNELGLNSYIINVDNDWQKRIEEFFKKKNHIIHWNNTRSIFWLCA